MDSSALLQIISKIPSLKYRYIGCFNPNSLVFPMPNDTFQIDNTTTKVDGHWITLVRFDGIYYFGDSLKASNLKQYPQLFNNLPTQIMFLPLNTTVKQQDSICGLYCIYFAWTIFDNNVPINVMNDFDLYKLFSKLMV